MSKSVRATIADLVKESLNNGRQNLKFKVVSKPVALNMQQIDALAIRINALPYYYRSILLFKFIFGLTTNEIQNALDLTDINNEYKNIVCLLSTSLRVDEEIDEESLRIATNLVFANSSDYGKEYKPKYSNNFKKRIREINIKVKSNSVSIKLMKRVAILLLIFTVGFTSIVVANSNFRDKVFEWIVETINEFTVFTPIKDLDEIAPLESTILEVNYVPSRFELSEVLESKNIIIAKYISQKEERLTVIASTSETSQFYIDTKDTPNDITVNGNFGYILEDEASTKIIFMIDDVYCLVTGSIAKNEAIKIAESLRLKN